MSASQDAALAFLIVQHVTEQATREPQVTVVRNAPKKEKAVPIQGKVESKVTMPGLVLPSVGSLDARGFMVAMRNAGQRRNDKGMPFTDQREVRNDQIKAIAAFIGYDARRDFGSQESEARAKATRELSGKPVTGPCRADQRNAERSMTGFVAGMPDATQRRLADLKAREVASVDAMLGHEKDAKDPNRSDDDRLLSSGLAEVERERLKQIRKDIQALVR